MLLGTASHFATTGSYKLAERATEHRVVDSVARGRVRADPCELEADASRRRHAWPDCTPTRHAYYPQSAIGPEVQMQPAVGGSDENRNVGALVRRQVIAYRVSRALVIARHLFVRGDEHVGVQGGRSGAEPR